MKFEKDILLMDFETTGEDPENGSPVQIGAILLDKETLEEKDHFYSYIYADLSKVSPEIKRISGITEEDLKGAPSIQEVTKEFVNKFTGDYYLSSWVQYLDRRMLMRMLRYTGLKFTFDYHYL